MRAKYQLICMGFDGEYQRERPEFETIDDAWEYSNDLGSKWFFYPFHFVVRGETIRGAGQFLEYLEGLRIKTVQKIFLKHSKDPEMENADTEQFAVTL
jgi:hypothetical protein